MEKIWLKSYPPGVPSEADLGTYSSLVDLFLRNCEKFKDRPALNNLGSQLTFQQLAELSQCCAGYFQQVLKLKKGDRIAIMLPNVFQYPICMCGAITIDSKLEEEYAETFAKVSVLLKNLNG